MLHLKLHSFLKISAHLWLILIFMRGNQFIAKCTAILLLVLFSQKIGVGVYLHNWLHNSTAKESPAAANTSLHCNCIDDFSTPLTTTDTEITIPALSVYNEQHFYFQRSFTSFQKIYHSLRAPPASYTA